LNNNGSGNTFSTHISPSSPSEFEFLQPKLFNPPHSANKMNEIRHRKRASQGSHISDEIELPAYSSKPTSPTSPTATGRDGLFNTISETETAYPEPEYTKKALASSPDFNCLTVENDRWINISISSPSNPSTTLFSVSNSQFTPSKPSVTIHSGGKTGPVLGVLNLLWSRDNVFTLGDPDSGLVNPKSLNWENLRRTSKWTHATYEFSYAVEGRRRNFVWQRTKRPVFADQPDLELREALEGGGEGKVLAAYKGCQGFASKKRGEFYVRRREEGGEVWGDWEMVVLLTGLGIIEGARRRARQRRSGGGGG